MSDSSSNGASGDQPRTGRGADATRDAERIAAEWGARMGHWMLHALARAKEEAEDIWADAQAIRREL